MSGEPLRPCHPFPGPDQGRRCLGSLLETFVGCQSVDRANVAPRISSALGHPYVPRHKGHASLRSPEWFRQFLRLTH